MRIFRRRAVPAELRPALAPGERILAWARIDDTRVLVVTNLGLHRPGHDRLGWHEIHKAVWSGRTLTLVPATVVATRDGYDVVEDLPAESYLLIDPGDVPDQVRTRVTRSVAVSTHHPGAGLRVVARRVPGVDGLFWAVRFDAGAPEVDAEQVAALVAQARDLIGP